MHKAPTHIVLLPTLVVNSSQENLECVNTRNQFSLLTKELFTVTKPNAFVRYLDAFEQQLILALILHYTLLETI